MFEISKRTARAWSRIGVRASYGQALSTIAAQDSRIIAVSADLGRSSGLDRFSKEYPDQFYNTGIAEQNMVGFSAGLARMGYCVFASTFAPFASMRASEQVRMNMGYMAEPVKLVALGSGLAMGFLGNSHFGLEDLAVMRAIPGLTIISPCDCVELHKMLVACSSYDHPVYIRLTGAINCPIVYEEDYDFKIGKANWVLPSSDVNIVSAGTSVGQCLKAAQILAESGINVGLLNMHTIKPLDHAALDHCRQVSSHTFVVEEHTTVGGLGSGVLEYLAGSGGISSQLHLHGIKDTFPPTGDYQFMLKVTQLDAIGVATKIANTLGLSIESALSNSSEKREAV